MLISGHLSPVAAYMADVDHAITMLDTLGNQLLKLARTIGYWTVLLITSKDCIAQAVNGDRKGIYRRESARDFRKNGRGASFLEKPNSI